MNEILLNSDLYIKELDLPHEIYRLSPESVALALILQNLRQPLRILELEDDLLLSWTWYKNLGPRRHKILLAMVEELVAKGHLYTKSSQVFQHEYSKKISEEIVNKTEKLFKSISNSMQAGQMNPSLRNCLLDFLHNKDMEHELVYAICEEASSKNKLTTAYIKAVLNNLIEDGIKTFAAYEANEQRFIAKEKFCKEIEKLFKIKFNKAQSDFVMKWRDELGYDEKIVELALKTSLHGRGLNYFDRKLRAWHENGLKTIEEIEKYLAEEKKIWIIRLIKYILIERKHLI